MRRRAHPASPEELALERKSHGPAGRLSGAGHARPVSSIDGAKAVRIQGNEINVAARIRRIDEYSGHADGPELARWIAARRPIERGVFLVHGEEPALAGLTERIAERIVPAAKIFQPLLDDVYELSLRGADAARRLAPPAARARGGGQVSTGITTCRNSILDINDAVDAAADDRARGIIIRKLRRALEARD